MIKSIKLLIAILLTIVPAVVRAEIFEPVSWSFSLDSLNNGQCQIVITGHIDSGWHVYTNDINPAIGPVPLSVEFSDGIVASGDLISDETPHSEYDHMFEATLSWWSGDVTLRQNIKVPDGVAVKGRLRYAACDDQNCIPPVSVPFSINPGGSESVQSIADDAVPAKSMSPLWTPVSGIDDTRSYDSETGGLLYIFVACFLGGFIALFTPCVWPMIPLTVSFFLKKSGSRAKSVRDALTYGLSIVLIYVALGLVVTALFGASTLNAIATSAVCNIIFFGLLLVFAISFFGAFEIALPSRWADKMDSSAEKTSGLLSIFFMAFTLAVVSFSCTGPIIGTLLVEAASTGSKLAPAVGMFGFSLALAIPFALFAMFPSWLKSVPRSGGWMNTIKVVLGFLELALSLKFLSVADLAYGWHILDREVFLALWIVIFGLLGAYLIGVFAFSHYGRDADDGISTGRFFLSLVSFAFTIYLIPGLWGAPLNGVSAFLPPLETQDFNMNASSTMVYDDYESGMMAAQREGKPVFLDFSGYGCVNCRKMESAVLGDQKVKTLIDDDFIVITLMVDSRQKLPSAESVEENGRQLTLTTYGERWSFLQRHKFQANAQPYYVVLSPDGELLSGPVAYNESVSDFVDFLNEGLHKFRK